jgi:selenocysteine lyase/cysteine desulfurase
MNENIRSMFPALKKYVYLNSAAVSPMPKISVDAVISQLQDVSENGTVNFNSWIATKNRCRDLVAEMLNVNAENIAFMRNTSDSFASVANGIDWAEGENIVTFEREFPANFYAWRMIRDKFGVELRICPEINGRYDLDEFLSLIDANTKVVAVSAVQFGSGYRADLERIGQKAREVDALFAVDMIQAFGVVPLDLPKNLVDIACGASHKWLFSPEGCGILYLSKRARKQIEPTLVGWISVENPWNFNDTEQPFKPNALAWESGTGGISLFYGLEQSLKLIRETGVEKIQKYLEELTDYLCEKLVEKGYQIVSSREQSEKSQIVCILPKAGQHSSEIAKMLEEKGIIISPRGERLRIAPHFFNNKNDIDKLIEALP